MLSQVPPISFSPSPSTKRLVPQTPPPPPGGVPSFSPAPVLPSMMSSPSPSVPPPQPIMLPFTSLSIASKCNVQLMLMNSIMEVIQHFLPTRAYLSSNARISSTSTTKAAPRDAAEGILSSSPLEDVEGTEVKGTLTGGTTSGGEDTSHK